MPVAVHIAAVPAHAPLGTAGAAVRGKANSADSKVGSSAPAPVSENASGRDFAALFRKQAGVVHPAMPGAAPADGKKDAEAEPAKDMAKLDPELKAQAAGEANATTTVIANGQSAGPTGDAIGASASKGAIATNLPKVLLVAHLKNDLSGPTQSGPEIVAATVSAVSVSDATSGGKKVAESSAKGEAKTKEEVSSEKGKYETANAASAPLPVMAVAAAPVVATPIVPMKTGVAAAKDDPKPPLNAALKTIPTQGTPAPVKDIPNTAGNQNVPASAPAAAPGTIVQESNLMSAGIQPVADSAANDGVAGAKTLEGAVKASTTPAPTAQHSSPTHAAISEMIAPAATPATVHGSEVANPNPPVAQQVPAAASAAAPVASSAPVVAGSAYDRMDQGVTPVVLHSGAQHVSVGVQDPNLGWVEIKTQNLGGHVDATLVTASGQSHDALAAQLPAMAQFMEQRDVRVGMLAVHHELPGAQGGFVGNGSSNSSGNGANYGGGAGYSGQAGSGHSSGGESRSAYTGLSSRLPRSAAMPGAGVSEDAVLRPVSYISVRA